MGKIQKINSGESKFTEILGYIFKISLPTKASKSFLFSKNPLTEKVELVGKRLSLYHSILLPLIKPTFSPIALIKAALL
ncbi:hypothetical protein HRbin06_01029 [archaeon HR06]|nr:hypothetical protein HRbin06_01029 [archaeon HR06]